VPRGLLNMRQTVILADRDAPQSEQGTAARSIGKNVGLIVARVVARRPDVNNGDQSPHCIGERIIR